ncbi:butyrophilin subfamily 1 member A1 [Lycodopsis pacificus]
MNMASMGILLIFTVISIGVGNAKTEGFISLNCKAEMLGQYGQQSLLECVIDPPDDNTDIRLVAWKKASIPLLVFYNGEFTEKQPGYSFAEPAWNNRNMNVSLLISNTAVEHDGLYECLVSTTSGYKNKTTSLKVTAKYSKPTIRSNPETSGTLMCESVHGYPEGKLRWFNELRELTDHSQMEAKATKSGLFQLSSKLVLEQGADVSEYTCGVFNASRGKEQEATFKVLNTPKPPEEFRKPLDPATKIVAPVVVIGSLIAGLLLALVVYRRRSQREYLHRPSLGSK